MPTLVVAGTEDRLTPPVHARELAATLPHCAGMLELEGTGHMAPLERDTEVTGALRELAARHLPRGLVRRALARRQPAPERGDALTPCTTIDTTTQTTRRPEQDRRLAVGQHAERRPPTAT